MFDKIKERFKAKEEEMPLDYNELAEDYVEINAEGGKGPKQKVIVRPFIVADFNDVKPALDSLREGYTIALVNIRPLKERDLVELKRAVAKLKKTAEAIEGDIAGFGEDWVVITPNFAQVYRESANDVDDDL